MCGIYAQCPPAHSDLLAGALTFVNHSNHSVVHTVKAFIDIKYVLRWAVTPEMEALELDSPALL